MKIAELRHILPVESVEIEENIKTATGEHKIVSVITFANLYRFDELEVDEIAIGCTNDFTHKRMFRLIIK